MKFISWNIDSLNAALTATSERAKLSRNVLKTIIDHDPDVIALQEIKLSGNGPTKKHLEILNEMFPQYEIVWNISVEPARKGYAGTMFCINHLSPAVTFPKLVHQVLWTMKAGSLP